MDGETWFRAELVKRFQEKGFLLDLREPWPVEGLYPQTDGIVIYETCEGSFPQNNYMDREISKLKEMQEIRTRINFLDKEIKRLKIKLKHRKMGLSNDLPQN